MSVLFNNITEEINNSTEFDDIVKVRKLKKQKDRLVVKTKELKVTDIVSIINKGYGTFVAGMTAIDILEANLEYMKNLHPNRYEKWQK